MQLNSDNYRKALLPANLFEVLPREIIEELIRGFFHHIKKGVTLLWAEHDTGKQQWVVQDTPLNPFNYSNLEDRPLFNKVCWEYRRACGDEKCNECDRCVAQEYVDGKRNENKPYPCWLGMDDLAYPFKVGDQVCGVLFAGQIVPNDTARIDQIKTKIKDVSGSNSDLSEKLIGLLDDEWQAQWGNYQPYAQNLVDRFSQFGDMVQQILNQLYEARLNAAAQELLRSVEMVLSSASLSDPAAWWNSCETLLSSLAELFSLEEIHVYLRDRSRYVRYPPRNQKEDQIGVGIVLSNLASGQLHQASNRTRLIAEKLSLPPDTTSFYASHVQSESTPLSTLVVLEGQLSAKCASLLESVCRIVTQGIDYLTLVQCQRQAQIQYKDYMAQVAHDFRTPLQIILLNLQHVRSLNAVKQDTKLYDRVSRSITQAMGAEDNVLYLLGEATDDQEPLDLVELVRGVIADLEPLAEEHPCRLVSLGTWPERRIIRGSRFHLRRAFTNLIENAIKYSYKGKNTDGHFELYRVEIRWVSRVNNIECISILNYGIGIPPDKIENIREPGRGNVRDSVSERPGTGWGMSIAITVLENHHGWLDIRSEPAPNDPRPKAEEYHGYITTVEVNLPLDT